MKRTGLALVVALLAYGCQGPPTAPTGGTNQNQTTQIIFGASPSPTGCTNPDNVGISAPTTIVHGTTQYSIALIPSVGGIVQTSNICPITWDNPGAPCAIANPGALSTVLTANGTGSCTVQGQVGTTQSAAIGVTVQ
jgi:hypothetical protein